MTDDFARVTPARQVELLDGAYPDIGEVNALIKELQSLRKVTEEMSYGLAMDGHFADNKIGRNCPSCAAQDAYKAHCDLYKYEEKSIIPASAPLSDDDIPF